MHIVLLTRPTTLQGILIIDTLVREGLPLAAVVLDPKPYTERRTRLLKVYRENGLMDTVRKLSRILVEDHLMARFRSRPSLPAATVPALCARHGIPVHSVPNHNRLESEALLRSLAPDLLLLAGTRIIKGNILGVPRLGTVNAHPGWLPAYRGRNCNLWAFLDGGPTGISTHFVDAGVDTGAILLRKPFPISSGDTILDIEYRAARQGAMMIAETVRGLASGSITPMPQRADDGRQYPALPVRLETEVRRRLRVRGGHPAPGVRQP
jgi:folate-dependent phosphoribosylglycinamide formyltransferase PurN